MPRVVNVLDQVKHVQILGPWKRDEVGESWWVECASVLHAYVVGTAAPVLFSITMSFVSPAVGAALEASAPMAEGEVALENVSERGDEAAETAVMHDGEVVSSAAPEAWVSARAALVSESTCMKAEDGN